MSTSEAGSAGAGAGGGGANGWTTAGQILQVGGAYMSLAGNLGSAWNAYIQGKQEARMLEIGAEQSRYKASEYREDATALSKAAGDVQTQGQETAAIRGLRLGQDIGRIFSGAAGSGIDVNSATVQHVAKGTRSEGYRDMSAISKSAANQSQSYINQAISARKNAIWADYDAVVQNLNADLAKQAGRRQMIGGILSAAGMFIGQAGGPLTKLIANSGSGA